MRDRVRGEETTSSEGNALLIHSQSVHSLVDEINRALQHYDGLHHQLGIYKMMKDGATQAKIIEEIKVSSEQVIARVRDLTKYSETWK